MANIAGGLEVHPARIRRRVDDELPFMATEELIVRAVRAGGDRQEAHEVIRRHSDRRGARDEGRGAPRNDLLERLAGDPEFGVPIERPARRARARRASSAARRSRWTSSSPRWSSRCSPARAVDARDVEEVRV